MLLRIDDHDGCGTPFPDFCCRRTVNGGALVTTLPAVRMPPAMTGTMLVAVVEEVTEAMEAMTGIPAVTRLAGMVSVNPEVNCWPFDVTMPTGVPGTAEGRPDSG